MLGILRKPVECEKLITAICHVIQSHSATISLSYYYVIVTYHTLPHYHVLSYRHRYYTLSTIKITVTNGKA